MTDGTGTEVPRARSAPDACDLPRPEGTRWWRFAALLYGEGGPFGVTCLFLRHHGPATDTGVPQSAHALVWARADAATRTRVGESWMDPAAVELIRRTVAGDRHMDPRVRDAFGEALAQGRPLGPDRPLPGPVRAGATGLDLDFGGVGVLREEDDGSHLVEAGTEGSGLSLRFAVGDLGSASPEQREGGPVPRLEVTGVLRQDGAHTAVRGQGWYEHFHSRSWHQDPATDQALRAGRTRVRLHLDNGWEVHACATGGSDGRAGRALLRTPQGEVIEAPMTLRGSSPWTSLATLNTYATVYELTVPRTALDLRARVWFPKQENRSSLVLPGTLEAWADVEGAFGGEPVRGWGTVDVLPLGRFDDFEEHITRIRDTTSREIRRLFPDEPRRRELVTVAGLEERPDVLDELVVQTLHESLVRPIRHITDGLGKSMRSYVITATVELFGVDSEPYRPLLGAVEILQSGNLVVDDVEDRSPMRRGRPAVHTVFGEATAINAGTAAYFVLDGVLRRVLPDDDRLRRRIYEVYLGVIRAAHAGQALDIAGHREAMDAAVTGGNAEAVLRRIRATHRLKTAAPVRGLAEIGGLVARAEERQLAALRDYFEAVGMAYQVSDDVMDLRGLSARGESGETVATKHVAEDLRAGKVTMPLGHAVALLPGPLMREVWATVRDGGVDAATTAEIVTLLEGHGVIDACLGEAERVVDQAWAPFHDLLPGNHLAVMIRALGRYAVRRERE
ncbi:polyprenyl synthetase family protein [Marinactinospora thermotolerans]|uniref:polyprenyl synthetase family protein n=1 Tax=Marinactinospora thermotolerans TaxID=531310 RepID=UPI003D91F1A5